MTTNPEVILTDIRNLLTVVVCFLVLVSALKFATFMLTLCRLCKDLEDQQGPINTTTTMDSEATGETNPPPTCVDIIEDSGADNDKNSIPMVPISLGEHHGASIRQITPANGESHQRQAEHSSRTVKICEVHV